MSASLFFQRPQVFTRLDNLLRWGAVVAILGPKGVGKSTIVKNYLALKKKRWVVFSLGQSLKETLVQALGPAHVSSSFESLNSNPSYSIDDTEKTLFEFSQTLAPEEIVIWEDVHHLSERQIQQLVLFLKNSFQGHQHLLLSDEQPHILKSDIPFYISEPLSIEETKNYIQEHLGRSPNSFKISEVYSLTGGLPFLINIWSQSENIGSLRREALSFLFKPKEKEELCFLHLMQKLSVEQYPEYATLHQKFYLVEDEGFWKLQSYLEDMVEQDFPLEIRLKAARRALKKLEDEGSQGSEPLRRWWIALGVGLKKELLSEGLNILPSQLENLPQSRLQQVVKNLEKPIVSLRSQLKFSDEEGRFIRLYLKSSVLLGETGQTVQMLKMILSTLIETPSLSEELQWTTYEIIYFYNRAQLERELLDKALLTLQNKVKGLLKYLVQIEMAYPYVTTDPQRALKTFVRVIEDCERDHHSHLRMAQGHAALQAAFCYERLLDVDKIRQYYDLAEKYYLAANSHYHASLCQLNRLLERSDFSELSETRRQILELRTAAERRGYNYIISALHYAQSKLYASEFKLEAALAESSLALQKAPEGVSPTLLDLYYRHRFEILIRMGRIQEALRMTSTYPVLKSFKLYQIYTTDSWSEDFLDELSMGGGFNLSPFQYLIYSLLRTDLKSKWNQTHLNLPNPTLAWLQLEKELRAQGPSRTPRETLIQLVHSMKEILNSLEVSQLQKTPEYWAMILLETQFIPKSQQAIVIETLMAQIKESLLDPIICGMFLAMLESLKCGTQLSEHPLWLKVPFVERRRWGSYYFQDLHAKKESFLITTAQGTIEKNSIQHLSEKQFDLLLIEHLGLVYFQQIEFSEFHRKNVLRQILGLILEMYPKAIQKSQIALVVWGEEYSPMVHDARIYTSIQRLRTLLKWKNAPSERGARRVNHKVEVIESWSGGYRLNPQVNFCYVKPLNPDVVGQDKIQVLILKALRNHQKSQRPWVSRSELVEITQSSDSTVKRELTQLLTAELIQRKGAGPSVSYSIR